MNDIPDTAQDRDTRIENFAAELTCAVYPLVLRRGLKDSWLEVELSLWRALAETVQRWARQRPVAAAADELEAWQEGLIVDLAESALYFAVINGIKGPVVDLRLGLYRAVHLVTRRHSRVRQSE